MIVEDETRFGTYCLCINSLVLHLLHLRKRVNNNQRIQTIEFLIGCVTVCPGFFSRNTPCITFLIVSNTQEGYSYSNGIEVTQAILYKVNGDCHSAPSIQEQYTVLYGPFFNKQNHDIKMKKEVWNFFKNQTL